MPFIATPPPTESTEFGKGKLNPQVQLIYSISNKPDMSNSALESSCVFDFWKSNLTSKVLTDYNLTETLVEYGIEISDKEEVSTFLSENPDLIELILISKKYISKYFEDFKLQLDTHQDSIDGFQSLNLFILNNLTAEAALKAERELFRGWLLPYYAKFDGKLNIREKYSNAF
jgi:hypothetical protein